MENRTQLLIPTDLKVGFNERPETYNGLLAFITYINARGEITQERAWKGWINGNNSSLGGGENQRRQRMGTSYVPMPILDIKNDKTSGFVINKKVGGYKTEFSVRDTYTRIFDPRGFEFEIDVPNLLYIIKNNGISKGGELQGEFVYAWNGGSVILLPVESTDYHQSMTFSVLQTEKVSKRSLVKGNIYENDSQETLIYLGDVVVNSEKASTLRHESYKDDIDKMVKIEFQNKKYLLFKYNTPKGRHELFPDVKHIKADLGPSNVDFEELYDEYVNSNVIGNFAGFEFYDITSENITKCLSAKECTVYKVNGNIATEYHFANRYKKWGSWVKMPHVMLRAKYTIAEDHYILDYITRYKYEDYKIIKTKKHEIFNTIEDFINAGFKLARIKRSYGKQEEISISENKHYYCR